MLRQAYCVDMPVDVRILGGAEMTAPWSSIARQTLPEQIGS